MQRFTIRKNYLALKIIKCLHFIWTCNTDWPYKQMVLGWNKDVSYATKDFNSGIYKHNNCTFDSKFKEDLTSLYGYKSIW
jgi:hypothetical protein